MKKFLVIIWLFTASLSASWGANYKNSKGLMFDTATGALITTAAPILPVLVNSYGFTVDSTGALVISLSGGGGGGGAWGSITGTLSSQTDLQSALDAKAALISPSFTTPALGTPSAAVLTNTTGYPWNALANPSAPLSLAMGSNTSIFLTTSAIAQFFALKNTTAAVVGTSQGSPHFDLCGRAFHGSADVESCADFSMLPGNGNDAAQTMSVARTGTSTGIMNLSVPSGMMCGGTCPTNNATIGYGAFSSSTTNGAVFLGSDGNGYLQRAGNTFNFGGSAGTVFNFPTGALINAAGYESIGAKFTASGCSNSTTVGGATAGKFSSGTTGACTVTVTMGSSLTATNGWSCWASDRTTPANIYDQSGDSTTTAVFTGTTVSGDVISFGCVAY